MERTALDEFDAAAMLAFEYAPHALIVSERRVVCRANNSFASMFELGGGDASGLPLSGLYPCMEDFVKIGDASYAAMKRTGKYEDERVMVSRTGRRFCCRVSARSLTPDHPHARVVCSFTDLSPQLGLHFLTARNQEVVLLLSQGKTAKEVARRLGLSPRTVETYLARIRMQLGVKNAAELISRIRTGLT